MARSLLRKAHAGRIRALTRMLDAGSALLGMYTHQAFVKEQMGLRYDHNVLLANSLGNQAYQSRAVLLLCGYGLYGSARPLLRQNFEALLIAKSSVLRPELIQRWGTAEEHRSPKTDIKISQDVFRGLRTKRGIDSLHSLWREFNDLTHATPFSQQPIRVWQPESQEEMVDQYRSLLGHTHHVLDHEFVLLNMRRHLLVHLNRKVRRFYFGYERDPFGWSNRAQALKERHEDARKQYLAINDAQNRAFNPPLLKMVAEYTQEWRT